MNLRSLLLIFLNAIGYGTSSTDYVSCGSVTKLYNAHYKVRLHSHDVKYGSGSGQQSVTGTETQDDHNSNWLIKGTPGMPCVRGTPIKCGEKIRLEHVSTRRNLHSHHFQSPLSNQQEVSAFGEEGEGDSGDQWVVKCDEGSVWERTEGVLLWHEDTDAYLGVTSHQYGRPIHGQAEVAGIKRAGAATRWTTKEGVFVSQSDLPSPKSHDRHMELTTCWEWTSHDMLMPGPRQLPSPCPSMTHHDEYDECR